MTAADNILELVGKTPLVKLNHCGPAGAAAVWVKLEFTNPSGSVKDRIAAGMIDRAEKAGLLKPGGTIVEPTSGNTGIALALVAAVKGYKMIAVMPQSMSKERYQLMELLGAKVELVPTRQGIPGMFEKEDIENTLLRAQEICRTIPNSYMPNQFENPWNADIHAETTAAEILEHVGDKSFAFVAACGTGGTFSGVTRVIKKSKPETKCVVVEPSNSAVISGETPGLHKLQGVGEGFIPKAMDVKLADEIAKVSDEDAIKMARRLAQEEGILSGITGGANVYAAIELAKNMSEDEVVVTLIPDTAMRYLSTDLCSSD